MLPSAGPETISVRRDWGEDRTVSSAVEDAFRGPLRKGGRLPLNLRIDPDRWIGRRNMETRAFCPMTSSLWCQTGRILLIMLSSPHAELLSDELATRHYSFIILDS